MCRSRYWSIHRFYNNGVSYSMSIFINKSNNRIKSNTEQFVEKAKNVHGNKYCYDMIDYINAKTKVKIICPEHGTFTQEADSHLRGCGCKFCGHQTNATVRKFTICQFIENAKIAHGEKYNYDSVIYVAARKKIKIICPEHGTFTQQADSHLRGYGCPKCKNDMISKKLRLTNEEFIKRANLIHEGKYSYDMIDYINPKTKVKIFCKNHGIFEQTPDSHIRGSGCPMCWSTISKPETRWLDLLNVPTRNKSIILSSIQRRIKPDGYDPITNTIYEFHGDFWHGNPKIFSLTDINPINKKTFGDLYQKTVERDQEILKSGFNLITIWESDFYEQFGKN